jgi:hypothetical protein
LHFPFAIFGQEHGKIAGNVTDPQGNPISDAKVSLTFRGSPKELHGLTVDGTFVFEHLEAGTYTMKVVADGFEPDSRELTLRPTESLRIDVKLKIAPDRQSVTVTVDPRDASALAPDPAERVLIRDETLDANPGHPGAPVSLPGLPIETASGGIKAPQYFAPGVAGDHGEPIAQFYQIGNFLYPNNLPANAHGNGYADPNFLMHHLSRRSPWMAAPSTFAREITPSILPRRTCRDSASTALWRPPETIAISISSPHGVREILQPTAGWPPKPPMATDSCNALSIASNTS